MPRRHVRRPVAERAGTGFVTAAGRTDPGAPAVRCPGAGDVPAAALGAGALSSPTDASPRYTRGEILSVLAGVMLAMLLAALDQTIVATALPTIAGELGGVDGLSWIVTAYLLTTAATTPLYGKLSDLYGRGPVIRIAIVLFVLGSVLCGLSRSVGELVLFRAVQGLGAGGLMTLAFTVIADVVAPRERGRYQAHVSSVFVLASIGGPVLGGFLTEQASWRWVFYVNLPLGIAAYVMAGRPLDRLPPPSGTPRIDVPGALLVAGAAACLLLALLSGGTEAPWLSWPILGLFVAGLVLSAAFAARELRAPEPIIPPGLFRGPVFATACAAATIATMVMLGGITLLPLYLQTVVGVSVSRSRLNLLPLMIGNVVSAVAVGRRVAATGRYRLFPGLGLGIAGIAFLVWAASGWREPGGALVVFLLVVGLGLGMVMPVLTLSVQNAVERRHLGAATSSLAFFRTLGGAFGVALLGAVLANGIERRLAGRVAAAQIDAMLGRGMPSGDASRVLAMSRPVRVLVLDAFASSYDLVFAAAGLLCLLGLAVAAFLRQLPLAGGPGARPG
jgi:EmrB/QacA subfamily drug resistance transporter